MDRHALGLIRYLLKVLEKIMFSSQRQLLADMMNILCDRILFEIEKHHGSASINARVGNGQ